MSRIRFTPALARPVPGLRRHCRSPIGYLLTEWRSGRGRPFRVGLAHGANCLACCWALMALAFVLGVMNLWWMAALTLVMLVEKMAPNGERFSRGLGAALLVWGLGLLLAG